MSEKPRFYKRRSVRIAAVVAAIPLLALAWWLLSPLFIDQVVDEPFPRAAMAVIPPDMTAEEVEQAMMEMETVETPSYEDMPEPEPAAPAATPATTTAPEATETAEPDQTDSEDGAGTTTAATSPPATTEATEPPPPTTVPTTIPAPEQTRPVALATGALMDGDSYHKGSGQVTLYRLEDGTHLVRMEDISVTNGPQLHVLLAPVPRVANRSELHDAGYVDLGGLKGNIGNQNYEVPADYPIPEEMTLVIYCVPFQVIFATAPMA